MEAMDITAASSFYGAWWEEDGRKADGKGSVCGRKIGIIICVEGNLHKIAFTIAYSGWHGRWKRRRSHSHSRNGNGNRLILLLLQVMCLCVWNWFRLCCAVRLLAGMTNWIKNVQCNCHYNWVAFKGFRDWNILFVSEWWLRWYSISRNI